MGFGGWGPEPEVRARRLGVRRLGVRRLRFGSARGTMRGCAKESKATRRKACVRATRPSGHTWLG